MDNQRARLLHLATSASLAVAVTLVVAKALAWWHSGSVSLLAGLTDSLLDGAASLLNLLAVRYSLRPADDDHRYGHGKAESLSGMGQALFISVSAVLIGSQALDRLQHPEPLGATGWGILVMQMARDFDGEIRVRIARESVAVLMDEELPADVSERMLELVRQVPGVVGAHDLRTRISGERWFVQLHLELPGDMPLSQAHTLCDQAVLAIRAEFPRAEVLVHADPLEVVGRETIS